MSDGSSKAPYGNSPVADSDGENLYQQEAEAMESKAGTSGLPLDSQEAGSEIQELLDAGYEIVQIDGVDYLSVDGESIGPVSDVLPAPEIRERGRGEALDSLVFPEPVCFNQQFRDRFKGTDEQLLRAFSRLIRLHRRRWPKSLIFFRSMPGIGL
jgi:hypothetical protein